MKNHKTSKQLCALLAACALGLAPTAVWAQSNNIALGKPVTFSTNPNYALSTDPDDKIQLTDGKFSSLGELQTVENTTSIWVQKGTVGWQYVNPTIFTVDLGSVQPISGVSYSTAAGRAGVPWPNMVYIAVSDDNVTWNALGDLVAMSRKNGTPPAEGYAPFRYTTRDLKTKGRYVSFAVVSTPYTFVDEVEVYAGDSQWLNSAAGGEVVTDIKQYVTKNLAIAGVRNRLKSDVEAVRALAQATNIPTARRNALLARLSEHASTIDNISSISDDFKAIVPYNDTHRNILAIHGELLSAQGVKPLTIWKQHRYAWLPLLSKPTSGQASELHFSMLKNQFRSDALLLTNAGSTPKTVNLKLANAPKNAQSGWLKVDAVAWTDTLDGTVVPDALIPVEARNGTYTVTIPAGMTQKMWLTVDSSKVPAGSTRSTLEVSGGEAPMRVPVEFNVFNINAGKPRLSLGMWDYTDGKGTYGITEQNRDAAIALMRSHYVDTPWATGVALPRPGAASFDAQGNLKGKLDFTYLDEWMARWPDARRYFVFAAVGDSFAGVKMDAPEFAPRVGSWAKAISAHVKEKGLKPSQLGILLVDEPHNDTQDAIIAAWAKAINAAAPELTLFQDPTWERPDQNKIQEAITEVDVICPMVPIYYKGGQPVKEYYEKLRGQGKELWFYQCTGPVRTYDPQTYFRYQAWHTFAIGGTGQGFWSFGDTGGAPSSWNEYTGARVSYAPAFLDTTTVSNSIHWDAVREGMQDYEELAMLQDAIKASRNATLKAQAQQVLDTAVQTIAGTWKNETDIYSWQAKKYDPALADAQLKNVRAMLQKLKA